MKQRYPFWDHPIRRALVLGGAVLVLVLLALKTAPSLAILFRSSVPTAQRISPVIDAAFSPDGMRVLTVSLDGTGRLWDRNGQWLNTLTGGDIRYPVFSPNGRYIVAASKYQVTLWDAHGQLFASTFTGTEFAQKPIFSADSTSILTVSGTRDDVRLWDTDLQVRATLILTPTCIASAMFSPDGSKILTTSDDAIIRLWDTHGKVLHRLTVQSYEVPVFSPDGKHLLSTYQNGVTLWDFQGQPLWTRNGHTYSIGSAVVSPDNRYILTTDRDTARLWDRNRKFLTLLGNRRTRVLSAVFSPNGTHILTSSVDGVGQVWDTSGRLLTTLEGFTNSDMALSPDGRHVFTVLEDGTGQLRDINGELRATFKGHTSYIRSVLFSADGSRILTRGAHPENITRLWDTNGQMLAVFK